MISKIKKISVPFVLVFYLFIFLFANILHNHPFTWHETDTCPAYIISITQNSDTAALSPFNFNYIFNQNQTICFIENKVLYRASSTIEISRAPPAV